MHNCYVLIFSASREMDDEDKHDIHLENHPQVSDSAWGYSEPTGSDIKQDEIYCTDAEADCEVSADITTDCMDDYNMLKSIKHARGQTDDTRADNDYNLQRDGIHDDVVTCLPSVKCEEHRQELSEHRHVVPFNRTYQEISLACDANEPIQVKQEATEDPDGYDTHNEATRHWVVWPGGVLKEVKAGHRSDFSDITVLPAEECNENGGRERSTHTCTHHNNIHDEEMNVTLCTDSACGLSSTHVRRNNSVLKVNKKSCIGVKPFICDTCGKSFAHSSYLKAHERMHTGLKPFTCDPCGISFAQPGQLKWHQRKHTGVRPFTCDTCGKSYFLLGQLKRHQMTHTAIKQFTCDTCGKSYSVSRHLKWHQMTHVTQVIKPIKCDTCGRSYTALGHLKRHQMLHTGCDRVNEMLHTRYLIAPGTLLKIRSNQWIIPH